MQIQEVVRGKSYNLFFESNGVWFDDSLKKEDKHHYFRLGDDHEEFEDQRKLYRILVKDIKDINTEELMVILKTLMNEIEHKNKIINNIQYLLK